MKMKTTLPVIVAALAILTSQGRAQESSDRKTTETAPVVTRYDQMEKSQASATG